MALLVILLVADARAPAEVRQTLQDSVHAGIAYAPTLGVAALTIAIAALTFLSSTARNELFQSAARAGAITDFATFSWWEGLAALASMLLFVSLPLLPPAAAYVEAAVMLYVLLGLVGLLYRLTHIVYRHERWLSSEQPRDKRRDGSKRIRAKERTAASDRTPSRSARKPRDRVLVRQSKRSGAADDPEFREL